MSKIIFDMPNKKLTKAIKEKTILDKTKKRELQLAQNNEINKFITKLFSK